MWRVGELVGVDSKEKFRVGRGGKLGSVGTWRCGDSGGLDILEVRMFWRLGDFGGLEILEFLRFGDLGGRDS